MDIEQQIIQNWRNYGAWLNDKKAAMSVNLALAQEFEQKHQQCSNIAHVICHYEAEENGLPILSTAHDLLKNLLRMIVQVHALPNCLYAGHILSNGKAQLFFYFDDEVAFKEVLQDLEYDDLVIQSDPNWDTYFEFLTPAPLEDRLCRTEEHIYALEERGVDTSVPQLIEHRFHFYEKEDIERFVERCALSGVKFNSLKYTEHLVKINEEESVYLVKVEQEIILDSIDILHQVEDFHQLSEELPINYLGWELVEIEAQSKYLN